MGWSQWPICSSDRPAFGVGPAVAGPDLGGRDVDPLLPGPKNPPRPPAQAFVNGLHDGPAITRGRTREPSISLGRWSGDRHRSVPCRRWYKRRYCLRPGEQLPSVAFLHTNSSACSGSWARFHPAPAEWGVARGQPSPPLARVVALFATASAAPATSGTSTGPPPGPSISPVTPKPKRS